MSPSLLKSLHVLAVAASFALFALRGTWMLTGSPRFEARWTRIVPHVIDTLLLGSALALAATLGLWPFQVDWLTVKLICLVGYIGLGMVALRRPGPGRASLPVRAAAFLAALALFLFMVSVARAHHPLGAFAALLA